MSRSLCFFFTASLSHSGLARKAEGERIAFNTVATVAYYPINWNKNASFLKKISLLITYDFLSFFRGFRHPVWYVRYNPKLPLLMLQIWALSRFKTIYLEHNVNLWEELPVLGRRWEYRLNIWWMWLLKHTAVRHVVVQQGIKAVLSERAGLDPSQIQVIQNGYLKREIEPSQVDQTVIARVQTLCQQGKLLAVFTGNAYAWHGLEKAIELIDPHATVHLLVAGDYPVISHPRVHFLGHLSLDTLMSVYAFCQVGIGSLEWGMVGATDGSPLKTREYLVFGLPIVVNYHDAASDIPALAPYVCHLGKDPDALLHAFEKSKDKAQLAILASQFLSWDTTLKEILETVRQVK